MVCHIIANPPKPKGLFHQKKTGLPLKKAFRETITANLETSLHTVSTGLKNFNDKI